MFDLGNVIDLPLVWGFLIATAVFLYVLLDGFDLGCGILFPFAPGDDCRSKVMNSIAPFWDANETWLVLGGGGLFAAFPVAYGILFSGLYLPIIFMLIGLIFRGVAFEFRFKTTGKDRKIWDFSFHAGSLTAAFMQGVILGNIVLGLPVEGREFAGGALDWANGFAFFTGFAVVVGYALLGATWLIWKCDEDTQQWAKRCANYLFGYVALGMFIVSISMPLMDARIVDVWFTSPSIYYLSVVPVAVMMLFYVLWRSLHREKIHDAFPFVLTIGLFALGYFGIGISLYPWVVPYQINLWDAAAASTSLSLLLVGILIFLPIVLAYTFYSYWVFKGKVDAEPLY